MPLLLSFWQYGVFFKGLVTEIINLEVIHLKMITESPCMGELNKELIIGGKKCL